MKKVILLGICLSCLLSFKQLYAETPVSSNITTNTNWALDKTPYIVTGTVQIYPGATLTIDAGVEIRFNSGAGLKIGGTLIAIGEESKKIRFTSNFLSSSTTTTNSDSTTTTTTSQITSEAWSGIEFTDLASGAKIDNNTNYISGSIFKYCTIEYAGNYAIRGTTGVPYLDNNLIQDNYGGVYFNCSYASSTAVIQNSTIKNNKFNGGINIFHGSIIIKNNEILNNATTHWSGGGGLNIYCSNAIITGNNIEGNSSNNYGGGVSIDYSYSSNNVNIFNNIIKNNFSALGTAIYMGGYGKININYNTITENYPSDLTLGSAVFCSGDDLNVNLQFNNIYNNSTLYEVHNNGETKVEAQNCWWGTTDTALIDLKIFDYFDDFMKGEVVYGPYEVELYTIDPQTNYDQDNDGIVDALDNCPNLFNPEQQDSDNDGIGNICDDDYCANQYYQNSIKCSDDSGNVWCCSEGSTCGVYYEDACIWPPTTTTTTITISTTTSTSSGGLDTTTTIAPCYESRPRLMNYQGFLSAKTGTPLTGNYSMTFRIYNAPTGGTLLWEELHTAANSVPITNGVFSVILGNLVPFPSNIFEGYVSISTTTSSVPVSSSSSSSSSSTSSSSSSGSSGGGGGSSGGGGGGCEVESQRWLSVEIVTDGEMSPRQRILPSAYNF